MRARASVAIALFLGMASLTLGVSARTPPGQPAGAPIRLQAGTFDPLLQSPAAPARPGLRAFDEGPATYLVQFTGPVQAEWKAAVAAAGGRLDGYIPEFAFIVQMDTPTRERVEQLEFVRWTGAYAPEYKLAPGLDQTSQALFRLELAGWADGEQIGQQLAAAGIEVAGDGAGGGLVVSTPAEILPLRAQIPDVLWIEPYRLHQTFNDQAGIIMGAPAAWSSGYDGRGQLITVADTGLDTGVDDPGVDGDIHLDFDNRVQHIRSWPVSAVGCITNSGADDGAADVNSGHGTHVAGSAYGNGARSGGLYKGIAPAAGIAFQAVEQWTARFCLVDDYLLTGIPDNIADLFQESHNWGSRIHTNSWGDSSTSGEYTTDSQNADQFVWNNKDFTILFAAGNGGIDDFPGDGYPDEGSISSPATAKNVISIGASENERASGGYNPGGPCSTYGNCWPIDYPADPTNSDGLSDSPEEMAAFSSRGPTNDGRLKPDLVAPGTNILSTRSSLSAGTLWGPGPSQYYAYSGGTSMATPLAAGAAAVVRQYLDEGEDLDNPSAALVKALLINSAVDIAGYGNAGQEAGQPIPNNHEGWGRINLAEATDGSNRTLVDDRELFTGVSHSLPFSVTADTPLKVTLVWSDYPGSPFAGKQLVNDLDLKLVAPNGTTIYRGNHFAGGWSSPGGSADATNNVENVYVKSPAAGVWTIEVTGRNVPQGPQAYALVINGHGDAGDPGPGPGLGSERAYLPLILKGPANVQQLDQFVRNGGFEEGLSQWRESSSNGYELIMKVPAYPVAPHTGQWGVWLAGATNEISLIEQQVKISAGKPYLAYWHRIISEDVCGYDFGGVVINGDQIAEEYTLCEAAESDNWLPRVVDLGAYAGQAVHLQFRAESDSSFISNLFIDDVAFQATPAVAAIRPESGTTRASGPQRLPATGAGELGASPLERLFRPQQPLRP